MKYKAYEFTKAYIETSDGKRIELKHPNSIQIDASCDLPIEHVPVELPRIHFSVTIPWSSLRFRVGPFWMPPPPQDRVN